MGEALALSLPDFDANVIEEIINITIEIKPVWYIDEDTRRHIKLTFSDHNKKELYFCVNKKKWLCFENSKFRGYGDWVTEKFFVCEWGTGYWSAYLRDKGAYTEWSESKKHILSTGPNSTYLEKYSAETKEKQKQFNTFFG